MVGGTIGGKPLTYVTDVRRTIATLGHLVSLPPRRHHRQGMAPLRGWDRTHEYDAAYELVETIFGGHSSRAPRRRRSPGERRLQLPVSSRAGARSVGRTTARARSTTCATASTWPSGSNYWIATQAELYQRMADYEALVFEVRDGGREVTVANPTDRRIAGDGDRAAPAVRQRLAGRRGADPRRAATPSSPSRRSRRAPR